MGESTLGPALQSARRSSGWMREKKGPIPSALSPHQEVKRPSMTPLFEHEIPKPGAPPGERVADLPSPRRPVTIGVLSLWLVGWGFGLAFMAQPLTSPGPFTIDRAFLLAWMILWAGAGLGVVGYLAWLVVGREQLFLEPEYLVIRRGVWGRWWTRRWRLDSIRRLRPFGREVPPVIAFGLDVAGRGASGVRFESGGHVVRFARALGESEARGIVELLRARYDFVRDSQGHEPADPRSHSAA